MRSPAQRAQMRQINPYVGRPKKPAPSSSGPAWWAKHAQPGARREAFTEEVQQRDQIRQQEVRPIYPNRKDVA